MVKIAHLNSWKRTIVTVEIVFGNNDQDRLEKDIYDMI